MSSDSEQVPLLERAEMPELPTVPKEARRDIALLEREFSDAEVRMLRQAIPLMRPLYARRNALVTSKLQHVDFWPRVFANAPADIDEYIRPSDAQIISTCLKNITLDRFEVNEKGEGEPRTVRFTFEFDNGENVWFENDKLVKEFYWRKEILTTVSGKKRVREGMVSDPVRIKWKEGMDPTDGLLDAACDLAEAEKALMKKENKTKVSNEDRLKLKEYESLVQKVAKIEAEVANEGEGDDEEGESSPMGLSFFAWFGYRGGDVSAEESARAIKEDEEKWEKIIKGEELFDEEEDEEEDEDEEDTLEEAEIFPDGESLAVSLSEDLWPNALKYYVQSYEIVPDFDLDSDIDVEDVEGDDEDGESEDELARPRKKVKT
ncbi:NAP family protein [Coccidioides immitis RS]|uniref:NAP family protein n=1 Tax=Coccidioides immitis (strain RS) TaxID=246410 RepID=J3K884_COCIM|nr:NAP family protein [Coccidioides immitis RS]EAS31009.3 NAP family protein [Coccidioides immitis RS]